jgi:signal transduction histidine kinase
LIEDILLVSQAEGHHPRLLREPIDAMQLSEKAFAAVAEIAAARQVTFVLEAEPNLPPLTGDSSQLIRALSNMLRFLAARAPAVSAIRVVVTSGEHTTTFSAADQGPTLSAAEVKRLCEPCRPRPGPESGTLTGLELAITRLIAEQHGGTFVTAHGPADGVKLCLILPAST